jgi:hypothetical protein
MAGFVHAEQGLEICLVALSQTIEFEAHWTQADLIAKPCHQMLATVVHCQRHLSCRACTMFERPEREVDQRCAQQGMDRRKQRACALAGNTALR